MIDHHTGPEAAFQGIVVIDDVADVLAQRVAAMVAEDLLEVLGREAPTNDDNCDNARRFSSINASNDTGSASVLYDMAIHPLAT